MMIVYVVSSRELLCLLALCLSMMIILISLVKDMTSMKLVII
jgi:hypothetical protein